MNVSIQSKQELVEYTIAHRQLAIRNARKSFWSFCRLLYPDFYKEDRAYLKDLCNTLQDFYEDKIDKKILTISMPPRHGKTFTARLFILWVFGQNSRMKIITGSYNQILSGLFAQQTRDGIIVENESVKQELFTDIFPEVKIKHGDAAKGFWSLDGSEEKNYLATSPGGTSTGIGANIVVVDDIIKSAEEAYNQRILESHWDWYNNTLVQRMERPRKQILIMTRWAKGDLVGRMLEKRPNGVHQVLYKAVQDDGSMLCDDIMTKEEYLDVIQEMGSDIAAANYQQEPIDMKGRLYQSFKTYSDIPAPGFNRILNYTDTADTGSDFLCSICAGEYNGELYVLDVLYTQDGMEVTEEQTAELLVVNSVNESQIESNNGGRGFARNVGRIMWEKFKTRRTVINWFHQSKNKQARILANSSFVMQHVYFPANWKDRWPEYYKAMNEYQKAGKNKNDDAPDATTGLCEIITEPPEDKKYSLPPMIGGVKRG